MISARFIARKSGAAFVAVAGVGIEAMIGGVGAAEVGAAACGVAGRLVAAVSFFLLQLPQSSGSARASATPAAGKLNRQPANGRKSDIGFMASQICFKLNYSS